MLLSGSRDKTLIIWNLTRDEQAYGYPKRSLHGHSHIVSDCVCLCQLGFVSSLNRTRSSHLTAPTLFPHPGTKPYAFGNSLLAKPPAPSSATPTMSSQYPFPQTTVRSSQGPATEQLSCGTLWGTASSPSPRRATRNGSHVCDSLQTLRTQSLLAVGGTSLLR
jgi:hypothetical protein